MRITATKEQGGQWRSDYKQEKKFSCMPLVSRTSACSATTIVSAVQGKKARMWSLLGSGLVCALFSLNVAADTGVCGFGNVYTVPIPTPALVVPGRFLPDGSGSEITFTGVVPIRFTCIGQPAIVNVQIMNPNMAPLGTVASGSELHDTNYPGLVVGSGGQVQYTPNLILYKLRFENTQMTCTGQDGKGFTKSYGPVIARTPLAGSTGSYAIAYPFLVNMGGTVGVVPPNTPCFGTQVISTDAIFDFFVARTFNSPAPLNGVVARMFLQMRGDSSGSTPPWNWKQMQVDLVFGGGIVTSKSCQISSGDVAMGKVSAKDIESVQAPFSEPATISITNCPANVTVALKVDDVANPANIGNNVLTLTNANDSSVAKGVGINLYYNDELVPITLGQTRPMITKTVEGAQDPIKLRGRYVRNGPGPVTAGRADAQATITLGYQ